MFSNKRRYNSFTLIELVVAIAIIALVSAMAVSAFRGESPSRALERIQAEFNSFSSGVRYRASEDGQPWVVYYNDENKIFTAQRLLTTEEREERENMGDAAFDVTDENGHRNLNVRLTFKLDSNCEILTSNSDNLPIDNTTDADDSDNLEKLKELEEEERVEFEYDPKDNSQDSDEDDLGQKILIFYPDGSAGGSKRIVIKYGELSKTLELSLLTGCLTEIKQENKTN